MIHELPDLSAMEAFGQRIAARLQIGDVVALNGPLGSGKTTLARAILRGLGHIGEVPSPSFTIVEMYDSAEMRVPVAHADFYRLKFPEEAAEIGLDDYREDAALLAEWPEAAGGFSHEAACLDLSLEIVGAGRVVTVRGGSDWLTRLP